MLLSALGGLLAFLAPLPAKTPEVSAPCPKDPYDRDATEVLREAARLIREHGHRRHALGDLKSGFCILGAICFAATGHSDGTGNNAIYKAMSRVGRYLSREEIFSVVEWNNTIATKAQVIAALEAA